MKDLRSYGMNEETRGGVPLGADADALLRAAGIDRGTVERYAAMSEDDLLNELMEKVRASRADGSFDPGRLTALVETVSPVLTPARRARLDEIVRMIKGEI